MYVAMHPRKISSLAACILPSLYEGEKAEEGLGAPDKFPGGRDAPGLLRSLHQASGQQRSVAQEGARPVFLPWLLCFWNGHW